MRIRGVYGDAPIPVIGYTRINAGAGLFFYDNDSNPFTLPRTGFDAI
jgi:hypothetical protein